jgi:hypothetical protein
MGGAVLPFKPTIAVPVWADFAPALAGLPGYNDAQIIRALLETIRQSIERLGLGVHVLKRLKRGEELVQPFLA